MFKLNIGSYDTHQKISFYAKIIFSLVGSLYYIIFQTNTIAYVTEYYNKTYKNIFAQHEIYDFFNPPIDKNNVELFDN